MRVIEAGNDGAAARVKIFAADDAQSLELGAGAHASDLVAGNCDSLGAGVLGSSVMIFAFSMIQSAFGPLLFASCATAAMGSLAFAAA